MSRYVKAIYSLLEVDGDSFDRLNFDLKILIVGTRNICDGVYWHRVIQQEIIGLDKFLCMLFNNHVGEYTK